MRLPYIFVLALLPVNQFTLKCTCFKNDWLFAVLRPFETLFLFVDTHHSVKSYSLSSALETIEQCKLLLVPAWPLKRPATCILQLPCNVDFDLGKTFIDQIIQRYYNSLRSRDKCVYWTTSKVVKRCKKMGLRVFFKPSFRLHYRYISANFI